jgi:hypothetical protein
MAPKPPVGNTNGRDVVNRTLDRVSWSRPCWLVRWAVNRAEGPIMYLAEERNATLYQQLENKTRPERKTPPDLDIETVMNALHLLSLSVLPFRLAGLLKARMNKNARLESVVEQFGDADTGSG